MKRTRIKDILENPSSYAGIKLRVDGWVKSMRDMKNYGFIELNDGSCFKSIQVVIDKSVIPSIIPSAVPPAVPPADSPTVPPAASSAVPPAASPTVPPAASSAALPEVPSAVPPAVPDNAGGGSLLSGSSVSVEGVLSVSPGEKQSFELTASRIEVICACPPGYPLQKKRHSLEFLRGIPHIRPRANIFRAVFFVRSVVAQAIHQYFRENGFVYIHTPIITTSDTEGAGEMFRVTVIDPTNTPVDENGEIDFSEDFFGVEANLTVSGQLEGEAFAHAFDRIYTFGPTFRAENSNTPRHAAEFWMIEPEMAFADICDIMDIAEDMVKYMIDYLFRNAAEEIEFLNSFVDKGLIMRLENILNTKFKKMTYTEAVSILEKKNSEFEYKAYWGCDLQTEHERYLSEKIASGPVFVTDYPKEIKAFYMRMNDDDKTVAAVDLLAPGVGELIGGSQREERFDRLENRLREMEMNVDDYLWYLDLRRYGGVKHSGFGMGFERMLMYFTGMSNIRDVLPFPKTAGGR